MLAYSHRFLSRFSSYDFSICGFEACRELQTTSENIFSGCAAVVGDAKNHTITPAGSLSFYTTPRVNFLNLNNANCKSFSRHNREIIFSFLVLEMVRLPHLRPPNVLVRKILRAVSGYDYNNLRKLKRTSVCTKL